MKWGRKKSKSSSSTYPLVLLSQVFSGSWLLKFKQVSSKAESSPAKPRCQNGAKSWSRRSERLRGKEPSLSPERRKVRSLTKLSEIEDNEAFWRLSFGGESSGDKNQRGVLRSVRYDSDDEIKFPGCRSCRASGTRVVESDEREFRDIMSGIRRIRLAKDVEVMPDNELLKGDQEPGTPRSRRTANDLRVQKRKSRRTFQRIMEEEDSATRKGSNETKQKSLELAEKDLSELRPARTIQTNDYHGVTASKLRKSPYRSSSNSRNIERRKTEEDHAFAAAPDSEKTGEVSLDELRLRSEKHRKSPRKRTKQGGCKVRVYSPRTASKIEICKIKALEDKKAKQKRKTKTNEGETKEKEAGLESFALVKWSLDPQKDFRESMVEMISDGKMRKPEELEELLACYLSLNSDEYHDVIIKAFRQVWLDMNQDGHGPHELQEHQSSVL